MPETGGGIFRGCQIVLDLDAAQVRFKQKQELRKKITDKAGVVSYIITKKVKLYNLNNQNLTLHPQLKISMFCVLFHFKVINTIFFKNLE